MERIIREGLETVLHLREGAEVVAFERYDRAIPQYVLGHGDGMERIRRDLRGVPGVQVTGNWVDGVAVGDCIRRGRAAADAVRDERAVDKPTGDS